MGTILVVEDTQDSFDLIADALGDVHTLIHARTGLEGIDRATEVRPDLILLDMQLPELDGLSVVQRLREREDVKDIPVVAVTACAMQEDRERFLAAGCDVYLSKPIGIQTLVELVEQCLNDSAAETPPSAGPGAGVAAQD
jgi:two-component system cell cycle response regulator DivK